MRLVRASLVLLPLAAVACSDAPTGLGPPVETSQVDVRDNFFDPDNIVVDQGTTVTWTWRDNNQHNVTFDAGPPNSSTMTSGTFARAFNAAGTFTYFCTIHGRATMSGQVEVR